MSDSPQITAETSITEPVPSALADLLLLENPGLELRSHCGATTPARFSTADQELEALLGGVGIYDAGYRTRLIVTGEDRVRWLNGMVTNTVQDLEEQHGNYSFVLNAQGRIQGDVYVFREPDRLLIETDRSQADRLASHLDHYIIMDDVELRNLAASTTALGVAGPDSVHLLTSVGLDEVNSLDALEFAPVSLHGISATLVRAHSVLTPRFELWFEPGQVEAVWSLLLNAEAIACGVDATEALRVLEAVPLYGVDISDRHLPQETSQTRALNYSKGCYLGQEIVERIRSRTTVHRFLRQFRLSPELSNESGALQPAVELRTAGEERPVGQLTSAASYRLPEFSGTLALGYLRNEVAERNSIIEYDGGTATLLDVPPIKPVV